MRRISIISIMKRTMLVACLIGSMSLLTACDNTFKGVINTELHDNLKERILSNIEIAEQLNKNGFISDTSRQNIVDNCNMAQQQWEQLCILSGKDKIDEDDLKSLGIDADNPEDAWAQLRRLKYFNLTRNSVFMRPVVPGGQSSVVSSKGAITAPYSYMSNELMRDLCTGEWNSNAWNYTNNLANSGNWAIRKEILTGASNGTVNISIENGYASDNFGGHKIDGSTSFGRDKNRDGDNIGDGVYSLMTGSVDPDPTYQPMNLVPASVQDQDLNEVGAYPIYVLKPDLLNKDLSDVIQAVQNNMSNPKSTNFSALDAYFQPATLSDGTKVTVDTLVSSSTNVEHAFKNIVSVTTRNTFGSSEITSEELNKPGEDLVIVQNNEPVIMMRVREFNQTNYLTVMAALGLFRTDGYTDRYSNNFGKYCLCTNQGSLKDKRIYMLEYPVDAIADFSVIAGSGDSDADKTPANTVVEAETTESGLSINLKTGGIFKHATTSGGNAYSNDGEYCVDSIGYYSTTPGNSSFKLLGSKKTKMVLDSSSSSASLKNGKKVTVQANSKIEVSTARIVLVDYLEASYAPGFHEESDLCVFGRKIRFDLNGRYQANMPGYGNYDGSLEGGYYHIMFNNDDRPIANYVNLDGTPATGEQTSSVKLRLNDFCDVNELAKAQRVFYITPVGETSGVRPAATETKSAKPVLSELEHESFYEFGSSTAGRKVKFTTLFPGPYLGHNDYVNELNETTYTADSGTQKMRYWAVCVRDDMFSNGAYADWLLDGGADWLNDELDGQGREYQIDIGALDDYLASNYSVQLQENGVLTLDVRTLNKIQKELDEDTKIQQNKMFRTIIFTIGWILIIYSMLVALCWVIDTNTDIGLQLLTKVTFGHWIAVKYADDLPDHSSADRHYITAGKLATRVLILITVGIIVSQVDIFYIVSKLVALFGAAAEKLGKLIHG